MPDVDNEITKRPKLLTLICLIAFVYSGLLAVIFLTGIILSSGFSNTINTYIALYELSAMQIFLLSTVGFLLFGISFWGVWKIYHLKRSGLYIFLLAGLLLIILQLSKSMINWYFVFVFLFLSLSFLAFIRILSPIRKKGPGLPGENL